MSVAITTSRSRIRHSAIRRWTAAVVSLVTMVAVGGVQAPSASAAPGDFTNYSSEMKGVYVTGGTIYAATASGLGISTDGGTTWTNKRTSNGLGSDIVNGAYAVGSTVYAATQNGLSISTNGGTAFTNKTTTDGLGSNNVYGVYATDDTVYAATLGGLSISTNGGRTFTNYTMPNGLGNNNVRGVFAVGSTVYAATRGGLSISTDLTASPAFTNKTMSDGLGNNYVNEVFVDGGTIYAATNGGLSISTNLAATPAFTNYTSGLGSNTVYGVYVSGGTIYAATDGGLSISTDLTASPAFTNYTTSNGLGGNFVSGVYASGGWIYAATEEGLSIRAGAAAAPGVLTGVAAVAGNATAAVSWTVDDTGGSAVTRIEFALDDTVTVDDSTTSAIGPHTLTGLVNGQAYTVYARAVNAIGAGPWSSGTPVTPQAPAPPTPAPVFPPGAPGSVTAVPGNGSATVTWAAPAFTGSYPVSTYQVSASPGGRSCMTSALTCEVSGLANGTTYTFTVRALSGAGWGTPSAASNAVTPTAPAARTILITGSRDPGDRRIVVVTGRTTALAGEQLTPWVRTTGRTDFTAGQTPATVDPDGTFAWTRKSPRRTYVYFTHDTITSNTITITARSGTK